MGWYGTTSTGSNAATERPHHISQYAGATGVNSAVFQRTVHYPEEFAPGYHVVLDAGPVVTVRRDQPAGLIRLLRIHQVSYRTDIGVSDPLEGPEQLVQLGIVVCLHNEKLCMGRLTHYR